MAKRSTGYCSRCRAVVGFHFNRKTGAKILHKNCDRCNAEFCEMRGIKGPGQRQQQEAEVKVEAPKVEEVKVKTPKVKNRFQAIIDVLLLQAKDKAKVKIQSEDERWDKLADKALNDDLVDSDWGEIENLLKPKAEAPKAEAPKAKAKVNDYRQHMNSIYSEAKKVADGKREAVTAKYDKTMRICTELDAKGKGKAEPDDVTWGVVKTSAGNDAMGWHLRNRVNNGTIIWEKTKGGLTRKIKTSKSEATGLMIAKAMVKELGPTFSVRAF